MGQTESFAVPTDLQVSQSLSPCPIARIWLLDADTDGSLLQALAFFQGGIEKPLYVLASSPGSRNLVARILSTLYVITASLSKCLVVTNM